MLRRLTVLAASVFGPNLVRPVTRGAVGRDDEPLATQRLSVDAVFEVCGNVRRTGRRALGAMTGAAGRGHAQVMRARGGIARRANVVRAVAARARGRLRTAAGPGLRVRSGLVLCPFGCVAGGARGRLQPLGVGKVGRCREVGVAGHARDAGRAVHRRSEHLGQHGHGAAVRARGGTVGVARQAIVVGGRLGGLSRHRPRRGGGQGQENQKRNHVTATHTVRPHSPPAHTRDPRCSTNSSAPAGLPGKERRPLPYQISRRPCGRRGGEPRRTGAVLTRAGSRLATSTTACRRRARPRRPPAGLDRPSSEACARPSSSRSSPSG